MSGYESTDPLRLQLDSPMPPDALIIAKTQPDGKYLYVLTSEGVAKIKLSAKDGEPTALHLHKAGAPNDGIMVTTQGNVVKVLYQSSGGHTSWTKGYEQGMKTPNFVVVAKSKATSVIDVPKYFPVDSQGEAVVSQELSHILSEAEIFYKAQLDAIKSFTDDQKNYIASSIGVNTTPLSFAQGLLKRYETSITSCEQASDTLKQAGDAVIGKMEADLLAAYPESAKTQTAPAVKTGTGGVGF